MPDILIATDAEWVLDEVRAALETPDTSLRWVRRGEDVLEACRQRTPDLVVLDLQIGRMGGMAACMAIRNEQGVGRLPEFAVLILLDRTADVHLARRCNSDGWLVKPLDAFRLRKAAKAVLAGEPYQEGVPEPSVGAAQPSGAMADGLSGAGAG